MSSVQEFYRMMNNKELRDFIRMNPVWYKEFNRAHDAHTHFRQVFDVAKREATPSGLERIDKHLNTAKLMLKLIKGFK